MAHTFLPREHSVIRNGLAHIRRHAIIGQIAKFGTVGIVATLLHVAVFNLLVSGHVASPLASNLIAFCIAFSISFLGNFAWTFRQRWLSRRSLAVLILRFLGGSLAGLALNTFWVYMVTDLMHMAYWISSFFLLFVTPSMIFMINKFYVFRC
jgi:putative flippase GtrA